MSLVPDYGTGDFCFVWTIENFSHCLQKTGEALVSPSFNYGTSLYKGYLEVYPRGFIEPDYIAVYLATSSDYIQPKFDFALSIRSSVSRLFLKLKDSESIVRQKFWKEGFSKFINITELSQSDGDSYLVNDSLTLRCRIWNTSYACGHIRARTVIGIEKIEQKLILYNFINGDKSRKITKTIKPSSDETQSSNIHFSWSRGNFLDLKILIDISQSETRKENYITCDVSVLDADEKSIYTIQEQHLFQVSSEIQNWSMPSIVGNILTDLSDLTLHCVFVISTGVSYNKVEYTNFEDISNSTEKGDLKPKVSENYGSLQHSLQRFYHEGKFSDVTIRTPKKDYAVHKAILCARSEVFEAMFEHDTKESQTGIIEIEDLVEDTVSRWLLYIYTDIVEDLDWGSSSKVYFAADKYGITALKSECSGFLKNGMSCENVCEVLVLADMHQDKDLKTFVKGFIKNNSAEIMKSEQWKMFMKDNIYLAAEIMHLMIKENDSEL